MPITLSTEKYANPAAALLLAMANEKRLLILDIICHQEMSVGVLAGRVGLSHAALSQHLGKLRGSSLVNTRRDAQTVYYSCRSESVARLLKTLHEIFELRQKPSVASMPANSKNLTATVSPL